eukprot:CAMPEP_0184740526 /NCGR_PEP_ID=MMETSP0315-20130426/3514_1 /TAXON_ID=101924 /ORGANISM="Rhodosorus marinus, Strain UTEX LB 2760" /LENGTH=105 /DNA_ID=CAMNT_0027210219 /DNA_START=100 /DNA_END=417 /DNA_ORIENTATION=-
MKVHGSVKKTVAAQALRDDKEFAEEQAIRLADKYRANEDGKEQLQKTEEKHTWLYLGESFIKVSKGKAIEELGKQSLALRGELEQIDADIVDKDDRLDDLVAVEE